jgi:hypothetical protein
VSDDFSFTMKTGGSLIRLFAAKRWLSSCMTARCLKADLGTSLQ